MRHLILLLPLCLAATPADRIAFRTCATRSYVQATRECREVFDLDHDGDCDMDDWGALQRRPSVFLRRVLFGVELETAEPMVLINANEALRDVPLRLSFEVQR